MRKIKLSPYHKIFYNEWQIDPLSSRYNIVFDQTIYNTLDILKLQQSLYRFVSDYLLLNSHVVEIDNSPHWVLNSQISQLEIFDKCTQEQIFSYVAQNFKLDSEPLYRFAVFKQPDNNYRFICVWHHILMDGSSVNISISEISNYYNFPEYKTKYSLLEQEDMLISAIDIFDNKLVYGKEYQQFWDKHLLDVEPLNLSFLKPGNISNKSGNNVKEYRFNLSIDETNTLIKTTRKFGITPYIYSQCIFALLFYRYTSQKKLAISYPIAIKGGLPFICGAQINTNLSVYEFNHSTIILDLFNQIKDFFKSIKTIGAKCSYYPIYSIIANANKDLLNVVFAETNLKDTRFNFIDAKTLNINSDFNIDLPTKLIFEQEVSGKALNFRVRYNILETDETILQNFINNYKQIFTNTLNDLVNNSNQLVNQYQILDAKEYQKIVYDWNQPTHECLINKTIHQFFEEQVLKAPNNIAIVFKGKLLNYSELNIKANQLAHYIKNNYQIKPDDLVVLCLERSENMIIAILAVLKSGAGYVPLDPSYPKKRTHYIVTDTKSQLLLTNESLISRIPENSWSNILAIDSIELQIKLKNEPIVNPTTITKNNNLAYVIYTSGTTGNPKGVMIEHTGAVERVIEMVEKSCIDSTSKYLFKTNYLFDVSFSDIFTVLTSGASLYITENVFDIEEICSLIETYNINICHFVPSQLEIIKDDLVERNLFSKLRTINLSGESFNKLLIINSSNRYVNYYGPTESGEVTAEIIDSMDGIKNSNLVTIGHHLNNAKLYILDTQLNPLPIGAIGELYIGGNAIARGYLNRPELTAERFIVNRFQTDAEKQSGKNSRLYKTGDLVRYLPDGNMEYIGRNDFQVKIRGLRVELSEIEKNLFSYPKIKQAAVLAVTHNQGNDKFVIGYYAADHKLNEPDIFKYLSDILPEYMLPKKLIYMKKLPITANGKLDQAALPKPKLSICSKYIAPRNYLEEKICFLFSEILTFPISKISVEHDFFILGGNSILAISLVAKLQQDFNINVNDVFKFRTPAKIAELIQYNKNDSHDRLAQIKSIYIEIAKYLEKYKIAMENEHHRYAQKLKHISFDSKKKKNIYTVLLTGGTGNLGCHVLYQLLFTTRYNIYALVRADSAQDAYIRLENKFKYYFDIGLDDFKDRVLVLKSNIEKPNLELESIQYKNLISCIDSIIHCAALVKHYGNYKIFYQANVQATVNVLELAKYTKGKDFHYISTIGVFANNSIPECGYNIFTENTINDNLANKYNIYTRTKYEAEQVTLKYREYGVKTNIYRIGTLAMNSTSYKIQENIQEIAFFHKVKTFLNLGVIPKELSDVEISPVDSTALAIVKLFDKEKLSNQTYHVFNPHSYNLFNAFTAYKNVNIRVRVVSISEFIDIISTQFVGNRNTKQLELFMLHHGWLKKNLRMNDLLSAIIFQDKTDYILKKLSFSWPKITDNMLFELIKQCIN